MNMPDTSSWSPSNWIEKFSKYIQSLSSEDLEGLLRSVLSKAEEDGCHLCRAFIQIGKEKVRRIQ
jgi:hypothetical protein